MHKCQHRNTRNLKKQGDMTPQKLNSPVTNTNDNEVDEISNNFKKRL
jgi:hypothetical protein